MGERDRKLMAIKLQLADIMIEIANAIKNDIYGIPKKIVTEYPEMILRDIEQIERESEYAT